MTITDDIIDDALDPPEVPDRFAVRDEATANWLIRKIIEARQYQDRIKEWAAKELRRAQHDEQFFMVQYGRQLEAWTAVQIRKLKGRRKSIHLPAGCIGFRTIAEKLVVDDEDQILAWARDKCPTAIKTVETINKTAFNEHFAQTGELPDSGAHVEPATERFYVR